MPLDQTNWSQTETETKPDLSKPSLDALVGISINGVGGAKVRHYTTSLDAAYLATFACGNAIVSVCGSNPTAPMLVTNADRRFIGVLMPARADAPATITARADALIGRETPAAQAAG